MRCIGQQYKNCCYPGFQKGHRGPKLNWTSNGTVAFFKTERKEFSERRVRSGGADPATSAEQQRIAVAEFHRGFVDRSISEMYSPTKKKSGP